MQARAVSVRFPARSAIRRPSSLYASPRSILPRSCSILPRAVRLRESAPESDASVAWSTAAFMSVAASASRPLARSRSAISLRISPDSAGFGWTLRRAWDSMRCPSAFACSLRQRSIEAIFRRSRGILSTCEFDSARCSA